MKITSLFVAVLAWTLIPAGYAPQQAPTKPKRIRVSVAVESEGPQGEWAQSAQDLTKKQLQKLEELIRAELSNQKN